MASVGSCIWDCLVTALGYWLAIALVAGIGVFIAALLATTGPITGAVVAAAGQSAGLGALAVLGPGAGGSLVGCIAGCFIAA